ncbi:MAG: hypothetical protein MAG581_01711 [Deltaproteobacteria bacterium]|jgi:hypothetical protein|nr:hypothetical protein [Deltaproteobacteria bacterium]
MKKLFYLLLILTLSASCGEEEESGDLTSDGSATSPVELIVGTAKSGSVAYADNSFYKFTTSSTGAGNYKLVVASLAVTDSWSSSNSVRAYLYSNSSYSSSYQLEYDSCLASCTMVFDYEDNLHASTTYYLKIYGYGDATYTLTVTKGGSEGSKNNPVELTVGTAYTSGTVEGYYYGGQSYYKFTTSGADNYTLTMNNSDSLDCSLYSDSGFTSYVSYSYNNCTAGANLSKTFTGTSSTAGLIANTAYYLKIEPLGYSITDAKTTTYSITIAAEGN